MKDTYIKIPTEVQEKMISIRISGEAVQCLQLIIRKTYGFHKSNDRISLSQFTKITGIARSSVVRALNQLSERKIIIKDGSHNKETIYSVNEDTSQWEGSDKKVTRLEGGYNKVNEGGYNKVNEVVTILSHTIDTITKDNITKEINVRDVEEKKENKTKKIISFVGTSEEVRLANYLLNKIKENNTFVKEPNIQNWAKNIDLLHRINGATYEQIEKMIDWCTQDSFWSSNILSTESLRRNFAQMYSKLQQQYKTQTKSVYNFTENL